MVASATGKTLGTANDHFTVVNIWYSSGATNATRAGSIGVQSGTIQLWGAQAEIGNVMTPLEKPDPRYDLDNCQRFYQVGSFGHAGNCAAGGFAGQSWLHQVAMRAAPTVTPNFTTNTNITGAALNVASNGINTGGAATAAGNWQLVGTYTASADL